jgi:8-oxo-dGTP pyrophosphatase MutT (NUDIX family)
MEQPQGPKLAWAGFRQLQEVDRDRKIKLMEITRYNVRVYGLYFQDGQVLVTDEYRMGQPMTKFPGGGHHFGEGLADCLQREFREELNWEIELGTLFYLNEFLQVSAFSRKEQIIAAYYEVHPIGEAWVKTSRQRYDFPELSEAAQSFRWISLSEIGPEHFTFPIDQIVGARLRDRARG